MHSAAASPWPTLSPHIEDLFRQCARAVTVAPPEWAEELAVEVLAIKGMEQIADSPELSAMFRERQIAATLHWAVSNVQHPGRRVPIVLDSRAIEITRQLVRRGIDPSPAETYYASQYMAWRKWMQICCSIVRDPDDLRVVLDVSALSFSAATEDYVTAVSELAQAERADLDRRGGHELKATLNLILDGAPISRTTAEAKLGYRLLGPHTAAVIWSDVGSPSDRLDAAADAVREASGASRRLTILPAADVLWLWLPVDKCPDVPDLARKLAGASPGVRVALGRPDSGVEGFRRSHLHALATQRMMARLASPQRVARFQDVQLVATLTQDVSVAEEFVYHTLGDLMFADLETREAVLTYIREQCNASRAADVLFTHRNTVNRRLAAADKILPRPLTENLIAIGAALEVLNWRGRQ